MSDQGDKIVSLAQQILQNGQLIVAPAKNANAVDHKAETLKAVGLAALVAAAGLAPLTHIAHDLNRPVNRYEQTELKALIFYAARQLGDSETSITLRMMDDLALMHMDDLSTADYRRIREYMWTLLLRAA